MALKKVIDTISSSAKAIEAVRKKMRHLEIGRRLGNLAGSQVLFHLASMAEDSDYEKIKFEQSRVAKNDDVVIDDQRSAIWNGGTDDPDGIRIDWNGSEFVGVYGKPTIWFWSDDLVCCYFSSTFSWLILSADNVIGKNKDEDEDEEKNRQVH